MTPKAEDHRRRALAEIEAAQQHLSRAAQIACPLVGWVDQWTEIGEAYDAVKALWHRINNAAMPERLDSEPAGKPVDHRPKDLNPKTAKEC